MVCASKKIDKFRILDLNDDFFKENFIFFWKKSSLKIFWAFRNWIKTIQTAGYNQSGYNGAHMVNGGCAPKCVLSNAKTVVEAH